MQSFDVIIIGAGPAGCAAALAMRDSKLKVALFEKEIFPRQKICGDGLCDRTVNTLRELSPDFYQEFIYTLTPHRIRNTSLFYKGKKFIFGSNSFGYACKRYDFDNFLFTLVKREAKNVSIFENTLIKQLNRVDGVMELETQSGAKYSSPLIIVANGAKSPLAQSLTGRVREKGSNGLAVRAYFKGISQSEYDSIELHYKKEFFPGYLWIFPMGGELFNVGLGYMVKEGEKSDESIKETFNKWIKEDPILHKRFSAAEQLSPLQGGLIPYNANQFDCSGNNFMITGDAASLIDPISGGGIGNAMYSGYVAGCQAIECHLKDSFLAEDTKTYEMIIRSRMEEEIKNRYKIQRLGSRFPRLLDLVARLAENQFLFNKLTGWYLK